MGTWMYQRIVPTNLVQVTGALNEWMRSLSNFLRGLRRDGSALVVDGSLQATGLRLAARTVTAATTATAEDGLILGDATAGAFDVTIPLAAEHPGQLLVVGRTNGGGNAVTAVRSGSDTLDGATSVALGAQWDVVRLWSDGGSLWKVV